LSESAASEDRGKAIENKKQGNPPVTTIKTSTRARTYRRKQLKRSDCSDLTKKKY